MQGFFEIALRTIDNAKKFVKLIDRRDDTEIYLKQKRYTVDGKSILGVFSLDLTKPVKCYVLGENTQEIHDTIRALIENDFVFTEVTYTDETNLTL